jgi:hypothetical protein
VAVQARDFCEGIADRCGPVRVPADDVDAALVADCHEGVPVACCVADLHPGVRPGTHRSQGLAPHARQPGPVRELHQVDVGICRRATVQGIRVCVPKGPVCWHDGLGCCKPIQIWQRERIKALWLSWPVLVVWHFHRGGAVSPVLDVVTYELGPGEGLEGGGSREKDWRGGGWGAGGKSSKKVKTQ